jgi:hypothetical protein
MPLGIAAKANQIDLPILRLANPVSQCLFDQR